VLGALGGGGGGGGGAQGAGAGAGLQLTPDIHWLTAVLPPLACEGILRARAADAGGAGPWLDAVRPRLAAVAAASITRSPGTAVEPAQLELGMQLVRHSLREARPVVGGEASSLGLLVVQLGISAGQGALVFPYLEVSGATGSEAGGSRVTVNPEKDGCDSRCSVADTLIAKEAGSPCGALACLVCRSEAIYLAIRTGCQLTVLRRRGAWLRSAPGTAVAPSWCSSCCARGRRRGSRQDSRMPTHSIMPLAVPRGFRSWHRCDIWGL
jgi:hypothetical protein